MSRQCLRQVVLMVICKHRMSETQRWSSLERKTGEIEEEEGNGGLIPLRRRIANRALD